MTLLHRLIGFMPLVATIPSAMAVPTSFGDSTLAHNETMLLRARDGDFDTSVEIGDGHVGAQDKSCNEPAAFTELWDAVENELCTAQGCNFEAQKCVTATETENVCIAARGDFTRGNRLDFIHGARGVFFRTIMRGQGECDPSTLGYLESATNLVDFQADKGDYSGFGIRVQLHMESKNSGLCGSTIKTIAAGGSSLPEVGAIFGLVAFFCKASDTPQMMLQATG